MAISVKKEVLYITFPLSGTTVASANFESHVEGWIKLINIVAPSTSANVSGTVVVKDEDGTQLWTFGSNGLSSGLTSAHSLTAADIPISHNYSLYWTYSGIPGSATGASATPLTATLTVWLAL